ncbi:MAG: alkaline phosphatase family protein, partial [Lachnospiraceae bacterium]|nr:alkaline phosphatase family protein [Lachnospiraceae bacterium]
MAVFPDYNKSIVSVSNSLLKFFGAATHHQTLSVLDKLLSEQHKTNIIFMILDCLSSEVLAKHLPQDSFLRSHFVCDISSVFPPTTTAATTSLHSGLYPLEHGWVGWAPYFKEYGRVIETFLNRDFYTQEILSTPPVREGIESKTIYQQITEVNADVEYHRIFPAFDPQGVKTFDEMCLRIPNIINSNTHRKIISAYWPYPDHDLHYNGTGSDVVRKCLVQMDQNLQIMAQNLSNTQLIITADHGIVNVEEIFLNDYPELMACLALPPSLEARFMSFFI